MRKLYYFLAILCVSVAQSQETNIVPGPIGCNVYFVIDGDNDGIAVFDIAWYFENFVMPNAEAAAEADLSGYTPYLYPSEADYNNHTNVIPGPLYTNVADPQNCFVDFVYNGNGPVFTNNGFFMLHHLACEFLDPVPFDGDQDSDGVDNAFEDTNGDLNLNDNDTDGDGFLDFMDADDDNDGVLTIDEDYDGNGNPADDDTNSNGTPDYRESGVALGLEHFGQVDFTVYPNPSRDQVIVSGLGDATLEKLSVYDITGKTIREFSNVDDAVEISGLAPGIYFVKVTSGQRAAVKKLIVL